MLENVSIYCIIIYCIHYSFVLLDRCTAKLRKKLYPEKRQECGEEFICISYSLFERCRWLQDSVGYTREQAAQRGQEYEVR